MSEGEREREGGNEGEREREGGNEGEREREGEQGEREREGGNKERGKGREIFPPSLPLVVWWSFMPPTLSACFSKSQCVSS